MDKNTYTIWNKFKCCGKCYINVIMKGKTACVMTETEYHRMVDVERKFGEKIFCLKIY